MATTIKLGEETKSHLDQYRENKNESYDDVIKKLIYIARTAKKEPGLAKEVIVEIEKARERIRKGKLVTEEEARKRLGL